LRKAQPPKKLGRLLPSGNVATDRYQAEAMRSERLNRQQLVWQAAQYQRIAFNRQFDCGQNRLWINKWT